MNKKTFIIARNAHSYGGAERAAFNIAQHLKRESNKVVVITNVEALRDQCKGHGIQTIQVMWDGDRIGGRKRFIAHLPKGLLIFIQYLAIFLFFKPNAVLLESKDDQTFGTLAASLLGINSYWRDHGGISRDWIGHSHKGLDALYLNAFKKAKCVITVCEENARLLRGVLPEYSAEKIQVVYNGVDTSLFPYSGIRSQTELSIGMISRLTDDKGVPEYLSAVGYMAKRYPNTTFSMTGDGIDLPKYRQTITSQKLPIKLHPFTDNTPEAYRNLDVFVLPTKAESLALAVLEAMSCGKIVVTSNVGGLPEIITDCHDGYITEPTTEALIERLEAILNEPFAILDGISKNARKTIEQKFLLTNQNKIMTAILSQP